MSPATLDSPKMLRQEFSYKGIQKSSKAGSKRGEGTGQNSIVVPQILQYIKVKYYLKQVAHLAKNVVVMCSTPSFALLNSEIFCP